MDAIRTCYERMGVDNYYITHKDSYTNPHENIIRELLLYARKNWEVKGDLLDLCCGGGEVSNVFLDENIEGIDPYTYELYTKNTKKPCKKLSFKDIVESGLDKRYDTIICSFAMHLCEESMLPMLLFRLSEVSNRLIILSPHKRPNCDGIYGWKRIDSRKLEKVNMILYEKKEVV